MRQNARTSFAIALALISSTAAQPAHAGFLKEAAVGAAESWLAKRAEARTHVATASPGDCRSFYPEREPPRIARASLTKATRSLCYSSFGLIHSGVAKGPLVSSTLLTPASVNVSTRLPRVDAFHADRRLPKSERAELDDYRRSGFDRGHMTPSADAPTPSAQAETFTLANIVPQAADLNRGSWADLEIAVRRTAQRARVYVATGPLYEGSRLRTVGDVLVPTAVWKWMRR